MLNDPSLKDKKLAPRNNDVSDRSNRDVKSISEVTFKKSKPHSAKEKEKLFCGSQFSIGSSNFLIEVEFASGLDSFRVYTKFSPLAPGLR